MTVAGSLNFDGNVSGTGHFLKLGVGTITFSGNDSFVGTTVIAQGTVTAASSTAFLPSGAGIIVEANGTLGLSASASIAQPIIFQASPNLHTQLIALSGDNTLSGPVLAEASSSLLPFASTEIEAVGGSNLTLTGPISGSGGLIVNKYFGAGKVTLTGNNSYQLGVQVDAGALDVESNSALGQATAKTMVQAGSVLELQGGVSIANPITLNGTLRSIRGFNTLTNVISLAPQFILFGHPSGQTIEVDQDTLGILGSIVTSPGIGSSELIKTGAGNLVLGGKNGFGFAEIDDGLLASVSSASLGNSTVTVKAGGTLDFAGTFSCSNAISVAGGGAANQGALEVDQNSNVTFTGSITIADTAVIGVAAGSSMTINGKPISSPDSSGLIKVGHGFLLLKTANSYSGPTTIMEGTIEVFNNRSLGTQQGLFSPAGEVTVLPGATLALDANNLTIDQPLTLDGQSSTIAQLLDLGVNNVWQGPISVFSTSTILVPIGTRLPDSLRIDGLIESIPGVTLVKSGAGSLTLTDDARQFAGTMSVRGGLMLIKGANIGGSISVDGGSLEVDAGGNVNSIAVNTGSLVLGNVSGKSATIGDLTIDAGGTLDYTIGAPAPVLVDPLTLNGGTLLIRRNPKLKLRIGQSFTLIQGSAPAQGSFSSVTSGFAVNYHAGTNGDNVAIIVVT